MVIKILKYVWQLPQNLLGLAVIFFSKAKANTNFRGIYITQHRFGVSLGDYIIINQNSLDNCDTILHERGHQKQSLYLGWLYLFTIGILSGGFNLFMQLFLGFLSVEKRIYIYYHMPWEYWADKLGGVNRFEKK